MPLEFTQSAGKHGIPRDDVLHAIRNVRTYQEVEYDDEIRLFVIGPDRSGAMLEVVLVPAHDPLRIIHADRLRPKFYDLLR